MSKTWLFSISITAFLLMNTADKHHALGEGLACDDVTSRVDLEVKPINNDSHCPGYVGAYLTNRSENRIICVVGFQREKDGTWNKSLVSVRSQQRIGGESGGLWACNSSSNVKYYCAVQNDSTKDYNCHISQYSKDW